MKRFCAVVSLVLFVFVCSFTAAAAESSYLLTPETMKELGCDRIEYLPEQGIYHFTGMGSASVGIPVSGGMYVYVTAGGYHSEANGVTDNGIDHVCTIHMTFFDENNEIVPVHRASAMVIIPADGVFHRWSWGNDAMYVGLPENVKRVSLTVTGYNDTAYIKSLYIASSDTVARDMTTVEWEVNDVGNINAQTRPIDRVIMIGFICAVALIMMIVAKVRQKYKRKQ